MVESHVFADVTPSIRIRPERNMAVAGHTGGSEQAYYVPSIRLGKSLDKPSISEGSRLISHSLVQIIHASGASNPPAVWRVHVGRPRRIRGTSSCMIVAGSVVQHSLTMMIAVALLRDLMVEGDVPVTKYLVAVHGATHFKNATSLTGLGHDR